MSRLLFALRCRFGLTWKKSLPIEEILDRALTVVVTILFFALFLAVYGWIDANEQAAEERIKTGQATQMITDCLHEGAVFAVNGHGAKCRVEWIKL